MNEMLKKLQEVELKSLSKKYMPIEQNLEQFIGNIMFLVKVKPVQMMLKNQHCDTTKYFCHHLSPMDQPVKVKALLMKACLMT